MAVVIDIGDISLNTGRPGLHGADWDGTITAGWDSPEVDQAILARLTPGSSVVTHVRHRTVIIEGTVDAPDTLAAWAARNHLEALVPVDSHIDLVVHEPTGAKRLAVQAGPGNPRLDMFGDRGVVFQLTLIAPDPVKQPYTEEP